MLNLHQKHVVLCTVANIKMLFAHTFYSALYLIYFQVPNCVQ